MLTTRHGVRALGAADLPSFLELAGRDPVVNVFVVHRATTTNLEPRWLGGEMWGRFEDGDLVAACHVAANLVPVEAGPEDAMLFADRALGARRTTVFGIILLESILLCVGGGLCGLVLGHGLVFVAAPVVESQSGIIMAPLSFDPWELVLFPVLLGVGSFVGFLPGLAAYRTDVAQTLSGQ